MNGNQGDKGGIVATSSVKDKAEAGSVWESAQGTTVSSQAEVAPGTPSPPAHPALGQVLSQWVEVNALSKWQWCNLLHPPSVFLPLSSFPPLPPTHLASATLHEESQRCSQPRYQL